MRILFFMRHQGYVKNFESTLDALARRGHDVHLAFDTTVETAAGRPTMEALRGLVERHPERLSHGPAPNLPVDAREDYGRRVRSAIDWLRYLEPALAEATKARDRTERRAPRSIRRLVALLGAEPRTVRALLRALQVVERATPVRRDDRRFIAEQAPDLVLVTPLLEGGPQTGYLRAARRLGVRTGLCVSSWDNLTSKGLIHEIPDAVTLWNDAQVREAVELHRVPRERIMATGGQAYDHWFTWRPSTTREEFCTAIGLDPDRPYLVYMCSSGFIGGAEADHIGAWIERLRARPEPALREVGILIRPHPINARQWEDHAVSGLEQVALWRLEDTEPATERGKNEFFDTVHHSAAVVGLNSTSLIESAILERPVLTLLTPEYAASQDGTAHFRLIAGEEGMLIVGHTWEQHAQQLLGALADPDYDGERRRRFVRTFIRPRGMDVEATDELVSAIERMGQLSVPAPVGRSVARVLGRVLLAPAVHWPMDPSTKGRARQAATKRKARRRARQRLSRQAATKRKARRRARQRLSRQARRALRRVPVIGPLIRGSHKKVKQRDRLPASNGEAPSFNGPKAERAAAPDHAPR